MKVLQDQLAAIRQIDFALHYRDDASGETWVTKLSPQVANVRTSAADCRIDYVWRWFQNGHLDHEQQKSIALPQVREVEVMPVEEASRQADTRAGHLRWIASADRPVYFNARSAPPTDANPAVWTSLCSTATPGQRAPFHRCPAAKVLWHHFHWPSA